MTTQSHAALADPPLAEVPSSGRAMPVGWRKARSPEPVTTSPSAATSPPAAVVLYGRDQAGRAHAARFGAEDAALAERAAAMTGLHVLRVGAEHLPLTALLPAGRVFASGKAFVPFVRGGTYDRIALAAEIVGGKGGGGPEVPAEASGRPEEAQGPAKSPEQPAAPAQPPAPLPSPDPEPSTPDPEPLSVGAVVLACQGYMEGWFEAVVEAVKGPGLLELSWRDWPDEPRILRRREVLASLPPMMAWQGGTRTN